MKRVDKFVLLTVLLFVAVALLETALKIGAQLAPFMAGLGAIYLIGRLWAAGKLQFVKTAFAKMMKPSPEPAERK